MNPQKEKVLLEIKKFFTKEKKILFLTEYLNVLDYAVAEERGNYYFCHELESWLNRNDFGIWLSDFDCKNIFPEAKKYIEKVENFEPELDIERNKFRKEQYTLLLKSLQK